MFNFVLRNTIQYRYSIPRTLFWLAFGTTFFFSGATLRLVEAFLVVSLHVWLLREHSDDSSTTKKKKIGLCSDRWSVEKIPDKVDCVIIGSGGGGLTCAAALASMGKVVVVCEMHDTVAGGGTHEFPLGSSSDGFKFDAGLHYTVPWSEWVMRLVSSSPPAFEYLDEGDGTFDRVVLGTTPQKGFGFKRAEAHLPALRRLFPNEQAAIDKWLELSDQAMICVMLYSVSIGLPDFLSAWWRRCFMSGSMWRNAIRTAEDVMSELPTKDPKLVAMLLGLWIDCGVPPTRGCFLLAAAVNRGLPLEGGVYPTGGSEAIAKALVPTVLDAGGRVLIRAKVDEIVVEDRPGDGAAVAVGVKVQDHLVKANVVVSACGFRNTVGLLPPERTPETLPDALTQSDGFLMVNLGIDGSAEELDVKCSNLWIHPLNDANGHDLFRCIRDFEADPEAHEPPMMVTFPSLKDRGWKRPTKLTCQLLILAKLKWFEPSGPVDGRTEAYAAMKQRWSDRCVAILLRHYPQFEGRIKLVDVSTPVSIQHWLNSVEGCATGLDCVPERFSPTAQRLLQMKTWIPGLWITGQDTFICGVPMAQIAGLLTALRIAGAAASLKFFARHLRMIMRGVLLGK